MEATKKVVIEKETKRQQLLSPTATRSSRIFMTTVALKNIIDTWNMIEKYNVIAYREVDATTVEVAECDYNRMLNATKNKEYIKNLRRENGMMAGHNF